MRKYLLTTLLLSAVFALPAQAADVGVSVSVSEPGFYGRIDIGGYPQPTVIYRKPVVIEAVPAHRAPIYLRVPPGHAKHWAKHCREYRACGEQVYFVKDDWYNREYLPRYRDKHGQPPGHDRRDHDEGRGHDHGHGHGHGRKD